MKRMSFAAVALFLTALAVQAQPLRQSRIVTDVVTSQVLGEDVNMNVYLPAGYDAAAGKCFPVPNSL